MQGWIALWAQIADAIAFLSRLPVPRPAAAPIVRTSSAFLSFAPLAGVVVATLGATVLVMAQAARLPSLVVATLACAATIAATGALHEDGLADVADGFGGGRTREAKLAIMRDSRIGTFGAAALGLALILRIGSLVALLDHGGSRLSAAALFIAAALSRAFMLLPMAALPPARTDGLAQAVGRVSPATLALAFLLALGCNVIAAHLAAVSATRLLTTAIAALAGAGAVSLLARRQIGGVTGDVVGASQQVAEIGALLTLSAAL